MPLLFLITYIVISYFIYKKNKEKTSNITLILKLTWIIAFALLFVFIVYYSEQNINSKITYVYSFYLLVIWYIITFITFLLKYKKILSKTNKKTINNIWLYETLINKFYYIVILFLSFTCFLYTYKQSLTNDYLLEILLYIFFILSSLYILFENNILNIKKIK